MDKKKIEQFGDALYDAMITRETIDPLTEQAPDIQVEDAYQISLRMLERRTAAGERVIGKKIGVTSKAVMDMLQVYQPDFGFLTDRMMFSTGAEVPASNEMIQPRAEGEIAFILKE
ncbi:MAG: 2-oxopent-4-enoate hydratase, partial [Gammaproteobacteria bacterium]|nr:2-oxopent-4-enoate hydratase [Gammaproteobacteria bacterium]